MTPAIDQVAHKYRALNCNSIAIGLADLLNLRIPLNVATDSGLKAATEST